ncbi:hypothetical protein [Segatella oris]|jgi:hypothetical protein|uniref:Ornithine aminotransferase n=1 Tax=Segatella oris C735 TaxID=563008 RepID=D7NFL6_9BACT|nr:hypothetical protein [Segatella oris]EFI47661.1 hypothetical protein HMPREF0665_02357 [Segatella oris C735]
MFIDKDGWGNYSIQELTDKELKLLRTALQTYVQCNFGHVDKTDRLRIWKFDREFNSIMKHEK